MQGHETEMPFTYLCRTQSDEENTRALIYRASMATSVEMLEEMLGRLTSTPKECLQFADTFLDFEDHKLLSPVGLGSLAATSSCERWELTSVPIRYTDVEGEQAILAELFPDRTTRPQTLLDSTKVLVQLQQLRPDLYQKLSQGNVAPSSVLLGLG
ncbi:hypothetical protein QOT17_012016 [Balamuthia mandrillaris]